jgi:hypothetical protein
MYTPNFLSTLYVCTDCFIYTLKSQILKGNRFRLSELVQQEEKTFLKESCDCECGCFDMGARKCTCAERCQCCINAYYHTFTCPKRHGNISLKLTGLDARILSDNATYLITNNNRRALLQDINSMENGGLQLKRKKRPEGYIQLWFNNTS